MSDRDQDPSSGLPTISAIGNHEEGVEWGASDTRLDPWLKALPPRIGEFYPRAVLGRGGFGVVLLASQEHPSRDVALKVLRPDRATPEVARRFELESQVLGTLLNPGIAQIYRSGVQETADGPLAYYAMELVSPAENLLTYAESRGLDLKSRIRLLIRLGEAVRYAHQRGVIHRDLKPANVLVDSSGQPKVLDFGLARVLEASPGLDMMRGETGTNQVLGTPAYMSPEQASGDRDAVDTRSDQYSLGVIAYELITGRKPFQLEGLSPLAAMRLIAEGRAQPMSSIDHRLRGDLERVIGKAMDPDRARRYGSVSEFVSDLERYLAGSPVTARAASTIYLMSRFVRKHRIPVSLAAATLLGLIGTLGALLMAASAETRKVGAELASQIADRKRIQAESEQREIGRRAEEEKVARSNLTTAQIALRGAEWQSALDALRLAAQEPHATYLRAELSRGRYWLDILRALDGLSRLKDVDAEIRDLDRRVEEGSVRLSTAERGELLLRRSDHQIGLPGVADSLDLVEQALALELEPADRAYAEGLLAYTSSDAVAHFEEALRLDRFHLRAALSRVMGLMLQGEFDEAQIAIAEARALFPADSSTLALLAIVAAGKGRFEDADRVLEEMSPQLGPEATEFARRMVTVLRVFSASLDPFGGAKQLSVPELLKMIVSLRASTPAGMASDERLNGILRNSPRFARLYWRNLVEAFPATVPASELQRIGLSRLFGVPILKPREAIEKLNIAHSANPDALGLVVRASLERTMGEPEAMRATLKEAIEIRSYFDVKNAALWILLSVEMQDLLQHFRQERMDATDPVVAQHQKEVREHVIMAMEDPEMTAYKFYVLSLGAELASDLELARSITLQGLTRFAGDSTLSDRLVLIEKRMKQPLAMLEMARRMGESNPPNPGAGALRAEALAIIDRTIRQTLPNILPEPPFEGGVPQP